jgi:hypothetical protein
MFENPASRRDFARLENGVRPHILADEYFNSRGNPPQLLADYWSILSPLNNLSIRREIPLC